MNWLEPKTELRLNAERSTSDGLQHFYIALFPNNIVASFSGFTRNDAYFKTDEGARQAPKVNFGTPAQQPSPAPAQ